MVKLRFKNDPTHKQDVLMHESQVGDYIAAKLELHWEPGHNPHWYKVRVKTMTPEQAHDMSLTSVLWEITVVRFNDERLRAIAYWHTTPGLHEKDGEGAHVINTHNTHRVWAHPDLLEDERRAEESE
jgi:hypothetical protein